MIRWGLPVIAIVAAALLAGCQAASDRSEATKTPSGKEAASGPGLKELVIKDTKPGDPARKVEVGDRVYVTYTGTLKSGTQFDSNDKEGAVPFSFVIVPEDGTPEVIKGWNKGLQGMGEGGERRLEIPAELGYGSQDTGQIPANSDLYFDVKLHAIVKKGEENAYDSVDLKVGTGRELREGNTAVVHYTGKLANGKLFDSTYERKKTVEFKVGAGRALRGIEAGVQGMRVGGKRKLTIGPGIGYGAYTQAYIPGNSILIYEIELVSVR